MLTYYLRENDTFRQMSVNLSAGIPDADQAVALWFDLFNPTVQEDRLVESILGISIPSREEMEDIESSARLYTEDDAEFMTETFLTDLDTEDRKSTRLNSSHLG